MKAHQRSFFDEEERMEKISKIGDPLELLNKVINWEMFRSTLNKAVVRKENTRKGGRPSYDVVMMFKILVLIRLYNLSDNQAEYQINDRRSFMRFLGLDIKYPKQKRYGNSETICHKPMRWKKCSCYLTKCLNQKV